MKLVGIVFSNAIPSTSWMLCVSGANDKAAPAQSQSKRRYEG